MAVHHHRTLVGASLVGAAVASGSALVVGKRAGDAATTLALGLFPALLTAFTLVIALTLDPGSRWPALGQVLRAAAFRWWFAVSMAAVVIAAYAGGTHSSYWITVATNLAVAGGLIGSVALFRLLQLASGEGRTDFLGSLIASAALETVRKEPTVPSDVHRVERFEPFLATFANASDAGDALAVRDRINELRAAGEHLSHRRCRPTETLPLVLALDLSVLRSLSESVLIGRSTSPVVGMSLVPEIVGVILGHAGALMRSAGDEPEGRDARLLAAAALGQSARFLAWSAGAARESAQRDGGTPALRGLLSGANTARKTIVSAIDPDPPGIFIAPDDPWERGLTDPETALVLWWALVDLNGAFDGNAAYAAYEVLAGRKFTGSWGWGDRYLLTELAQAVAAREPVRQGLAPYGGIDAIALELLATNLAAWRDRRVPIPAGFEHNWTAWEDPKRMARRARLLLPHPDHRTIHDLPTARDALAGLLSLRPGQREHVGELVRAQAERIAVPLVPPIHDTTERPAAAVLAVALHLAPRETGGSTDALDAYLEWLPADLRAGAEALAQAIFTVGDAPLGLRDSLCFLHHDRQDGHT